MKNNSIKLLDCTLRDGGYINDWDWGYDVARGIVQYLSQSGTDMIEVGFLRDVHGYNPNITVCSGIEKLNKLLPEQSVDCMFSAMAMRSNYHIEKLAPYSGKGIELIRITAHDYDIKEGLEFARQVKEKGYKVSINPINIMGYSDGEILYMIEQVNEIYPYQFSIVDTFGSMKQSDLERIVNLVDHNLHENIRLGLHLHENMSLGCLLAQKFVTMRLHRAITVDGSLMGMGRNPGNLPIELIADYLNENMQSQYDINYMLDAIDEYISPIKGETLWGYTTAYFLSARFNLHRNYAEYYLKKGNLASRDINQIFQRYDRKKATAFDQKYADKMYEEHLNRTITDEEDRRLLAERLIDRDIVLLAPGHTINEHAEKIREHVESENSILISVNFIPSNYSVDYAFFSNNRRWEKYRPNISGKIIVTSNLEKKDADYCMDYNSLKLYLGEDNNGLLMLLNLLHELGIHHVNIAGADGYGVGEDNYYSRGMRSYLKRDETYNRKVAEAFQKIGIEIAFITPSEYEKYFYHYRGIAGEGDDC